MDSDAVIVGVLGTTVAPEDLKKVLDAAHLGSVTIHKVLELSIGGATVCFRFKRDGTEVESCTCSAEEAFALSEKLGEVLSQAKLEHQYSAFLDGGVLCGHEWNADKC